MAILQMMQTKPEATVYDQLFTFVLLSVLSALVSKEEIKSKEF